jgi:hypothetical protein
MWIEKSDDLIGNRARDLPSCRFKMPVPSSYSGWLFLQTSTVHQEPEYCCVTFCCRPSTVCQMGRHFLGVEIRRAPVMLALLVTWCSFFTFRLTFLQTRQAYYFCDNQRVWHLILVWSAPILFFFVSTAVTVRGELPFSFDATVSSFGKRSPGMYWRTLLHHVTKKLAQNT